MCQIEASVPIQLPGPKRSVWPANPGNTQSVGSIGDSYDNAMAESLWGLGREVQRGVAHAGAGDRVGLGPTWLTLLADVCYFTVIASNDRFVPPFLSVPTIVIRAVPGAPDAIVNVARYSPDDSSVAV